VSKADDKFLFLSFCFEIKRFNALLNNENSYEFKTYLPIQLDGTCNGFQHLALLSNETQIFQNLNLSESKKNKDPLDFYSHIVDILNVHLEYKKKEVQLEYERNKMKVQFEYEKKMKEVQFEYEKEEVQLEYKKKKVVLSQYVYKINSFNRLVKLGINRKTIKPVIMNKPYNATDWTLVHYIRDTLVFDHSEKILLLNKEGQPEYDYEGNPLFDKTSLYKIDKNSKNYVKYADLYLLVKNIDEILFVKYPKIKELTKYFHDIAEILNKLNLPIIWRLPSGLIVTQKYMQKRSIQVKPFTHLSNTLVLSITDKLKTNTDKQKSAFMPNLVYSLDAATLLLLYNSFYNTISSDHTYPVNLYSVHDCYGVTANNINLLIQMLRSVYIEIYSDVGYIEKFYEDVINNIIISYGENRCTFSSETSTITIDGKKNIILPDLSKLFNVSNKDRAYKSLSVTT